MSYVHMNDVVDNIRCVMKGKYRFIPCSCNNGIIYIDGDTGDEISYKAFKEQLVDPEGYPYSADCPECRGLGKHFVYTDEEGNEEAINLG